MKRLKTTNTVITWKDGNRSKMLPAEVKHIACRCVEDEGHEEVDQIAE